MLELWVSPFPMVLFPLMSSLFLWAVLYFLMVTPLPLLSLLMSDRYCSHCYCCHCFCYFCLCFCCCCCFYCCVSGRSVYPRRVDFHHLHPSNHVTHHHYHLYNLHQYYADYDHDGCCCCCLNVRDC